jgi:DNA mismatch repair ATPase MutS
MEKYYGCKIQNKDILYLFKTGIFYLFLDADALKINDLYGLKLINFNNETFKCGFPVNSLDKYLKLFKKDNLKVVIVDDNNFKINYDKLIDLVDYIRKMDINKSNIYNDVKRLKEYL